MKYQIESSPEAEKHFRVLTTRQQSMDMETVSLSNNPKFLNLIERSRSRQKSEGGISTEEMRRRLKRICVESVKS